MEGTRQTVTSANGFRIGLLTAGSGPGLVLMHGGMGTIERWRRVWGALARQRRVTAMDRGRGSSGDAASYELSSEYADVASVAAALAVEQRRPAGRLALLVKKRTPHVPASGMPRVSSAAALMTA